MKPERHPKKSVGKDWHSADIKAALEKAGWSLRKLSLHVGYRNPCTLGKVLREKWPKGQRLIAEAIGVEPDVIWPSRYHAKNSTPSL